ncbi:hypothetical protein CH63R_13734 [Colletotrichum higginsianum IMI 349063]|uniref:DUF7908 domain-containing protein n=2 Tax=Colletotrichum higginsianum TaxID=80884 RepID=A0A1B7XRU7_COLHI|nr:hypothetical protein CH63R_13734 [Colletotrichum higginsianum IMI 349063]OBR02508.1 hypothetical protein CH63R_13734 [Colletotrichum higginsianum IMI 349063]TID06161.1 hypothetical protein CH35J_000250 [Colletotrichum higginsianum]
MKRGISFLIFMVGVGGSTIDQPPEDVVGMASTWCYTYLSTYFEPMTIGFTSPFPTNLSVSSTSPAIGSTSTTSIPPTLPTSLSSTGGSRTTPSGSTAASESTSILGSTSPLGSATPSGLSTSSSLALPPSVATTSVSTPTPSAPVDRQIILFTFPIAVTKRGLEKRDIGGFIVRDAAANRQSCDDAVIFSLSSNWLLDAGIPIHYTPGDTNKPFRATTLPSVDAITTTFGVVGGKLQFSNSSLPGGRANFCQNPQGQVFIIFTSTPVGCELVQILVYEVHNYVYNLYLNPNYYNWNYNNVYNIVYDNIYNL